MTSSYTVFKYSLLKILRNSSSISYFAICKCRGRRFESCHSYGDVAQRLEHVLILILKYLFSKNIDIKVVKKTVTSNIGFLNTLFFNLSPLKHVEIVSLSISSSEFGFTFCLKNRTQRFNSVNIDNSFSFQLTFKGQCK